MVTYAAFPQNSKYMSATKTMLLVAGSTILIVLASVVVGLAFGADAGITIFSLVSISLVLGLGVWGTVVFAKRAVNVLKHGYTPVKRPDIIATFKRFAEDNEFEFKEYAAGTRAPQPYSSCIFDENAEVDILYEVAGEVDELNFTYYCLAEAEHGWPNGAERRGMAYAHTPDGRRVNFYSVLALDKNIKRESYGRYTVMHNPHTYIYTSGQIGDAKSMQELFDFAQGGES